MGLTMMMMTRENEFRRLEKGWNLWMIAGAMVISFLGTFTATQIMIQARTSTKFTHVLTWVLLVSLIFGFCSSWSLHFVGMLSCEMGVAIGLDIGLTMFTGALAVGFTFVSLGKDLLRDSYARDFRRKPSTSFASLDSATTLQDDGADLPLLLEHELNNYRPRLDLNRSPSDHVAVYPTLQGRAAADRRFTESVFAGRSAPAPAVDGAEDVEQGSPLSHSASGEGLAEGRGSNTSQHWSFGASRVDDLMSMATQGNKPHRNVFIATFLGLAAGFSLETALMGLLWSLSLTCMHYGGLFAMRIPEGYMTLNPVPVVISAMISWVVCIAGYIYMTNIEPFLSQQVLFSFVAAVGIATMHFTGLYAATFYSRVPPSDVATWPATLPIAICSIAFLTCMLANGLLAHGAIVSRNKLAEIVWTRRKLWRTMAEKELAEAAAATRSSFIASASHEIRTPLHHLQGYTDLLARSKLSAEDRQLLSAIQSATRTLSLITNNVLDWSKLESDKDTVCRPTALDLRTLFESIVHILPTKEDVADVEFMVVIAPSVPTTLLLDETYIHRIFMNLLSNALKFTASGYVLLTMNYDGDNLIAQVRDTGIGIPRIFLPRLFDPFSQAATHGSQRGTGLGLSIIKQLLQKMDGYVTVESEYAEGQDASIRTGTTFTVTIPTQPPSFELSPPEFSVDPGTVALFCPTDPIRQEGQRAGWEHFGFRSVEICNLSDLRSCPEVDYIWADADYLQLHLDCLEALLHQDKWTVLVPYCGPDTLDRLPGIMSSRFVLLPKPLMWHTFQSRIALSRSSPAVLEVSTSDLHILDLPDAQTALTRSTKKEVTVLLVEDNPINQRLGLKMLTALGYSVIVANDGDEAIALLLTHDATIDVILMDQSMPNKDGVTATREIRELEAEGRLSRKHTIIAVTAVVDSESMASFNGAGADEFLSKPLSMGRLEQTLTTFLNGE